MEAQSESAARTGRRTWNPRPVSWKAESRPWWSWAGLGAVAILAFALFLWGLSRNGMANEYYAAAVKSGSISWKAWFFGALDPGSFITVDKLPGALWIEGLSARIFGFSSWSMLLPQALAGAASVLILYTLVRRWQGDAAGLLAALALALTPVAVLIFRYNNPDALLTFLFLAAAWAFWSALEKGSTGKLTIAGALLGLAVLTKMLEALVVAPAFVLVYLVCGSRTLLRRLWQIAVAGVALVVSAGWYVAVVALWPASSRPYIGGSGDNSVSGLIFSRSAGYLSGGGGPAGAGAPVPGGGIGGGPNFGGSPGWLRIFNDQLGGQAAWLVVFALIGLAAGLWITRRGGRADRSRAGYLFWGGWALLCLGVFSFANGVLHPYYTVVVSPALAALVGGGAVAMWRLGRQHLAYIWLLPVAVLGTAFLARELLGRTPSFAPGLGTAVIVLGAAAAVPLALVLARVLERRAVTLAVGVIAGVCVLAGPAAYSVVTVSHSVTGPLAAAGPVTVDPTRGLPGLAGAADSTGAAGGALEDASITPLMEYLLKNKGEAEYLVAVGGAQAAQPFILATGEPVIAMGGFNGQDDTPTLEEFHQLVAAKKLRYVVVGLGGMGPGGMPGLPPFGDQVGWAQGTLAAFEPGPGWPGGGFPGPGGPGSRASISAIYEWVRTNATAVDSSEYGGGSGGGTLYRLW